MPDTRVIHFLSDGFRIEADLYLPATAPGAAAAPLPAILLCHGFSGVRSELLPLYAAHFVAAGYAVLAPDFRGFGGSEGVRGLVDPFAQIEDLRSALTWLELQPGIDPARLGVWGTSNGGAHIVTLAGVDSRVKCAVGQVGYADGRTLILAHKSPEAQAALLDLFHQDRVRRLTHGRGGTTSVLDLVASAQSRRFMAAAGATEFQVAIQSGEIALRYRPRDVAGDISCALLLMGAEQDDLCPMDAYRALLDQARGPKKWRSFACGHYDLYTPEGIAETAAEAIAWYGAHL